LSLAAIPVRIFARIFVGEDPDKDPDEDRGTTKIRTTDSRDTMGG